MGFSRLWLALFTAFHQCGGRALMILIRRKFCSGESSLNLFPRRKTPCSEIKLPTFKKPRSTKSFLNIDLLSTQIHFVVPQNFV